MEKFRCRTCFDITDAKTCIEITKICYFEKTIKDVIIMLVPEMTSTLLDDESICRNCFGTLKSSIKFIQRCLEVELINGDEKEQFEDYNDSAGYSDQDSEVEESKDVLDILEDLLDPEHNYCVKDPDDSVSVKTEDKNVLSQNLPTSMESVPGLSTLKREGSESPIEYLFYESLSQFMDNVEECDNNATLESDSLALQIGTNRENADCMMYGAEQAYFSCSNCSEIFECEEDYKLHLNVHPEVVCELCGKGCKTKEFYENHMKLHSEGYLTVCEFCGGLFMNSRTLNVHLAEVHSKETPFLCDKCPKRFRSKFKLALHERMVHGRMKEHPCQECGKLFLTKDTYLKHYRLTHLKLKPYVCQICGMEFGRKDYLQKHMHTQVHERGQVQGKTTRGKIRTVNASGIILLETGEPVKCNVCGKTYPSVLNLKAHLQSHVKVKRFKCKYCGLTFSLKGNCNRHEKLHEADPEHKFRCNICWKKMKTEEEVQQHVVVHYNRPPNYACELCGEKFHRRYLLDNHRLDKHTGPGDIERAEDEIIMKNLLEYADPRFLSQDD